MKVKLDGVEWSLTRRGRSRGVERTHGYVLSDRKTIYLNPRLKGKELIEFAIHELLHARFLDLDEESVDDAAKAITSVLHRLGVRHVIE